MLATGLALRTRVRTAGAVQPARPTPRAGRPRALVSRGSAVARRRSQSDPPPPAPPRAGAPNCGKTPGQSHTTTAKSKTSRSAPEAGLGTRPPARTPAIRPPDKQRQRQPPQRRGDVVGHVVDEGHQARRQHDETHSPARSERLRTTRLRPAAARAERHRQHQERHQRRQVPRPHRPPPGVVREGRREVGVRRHQHDEEDEERAVLRRSSPEAQGHAAAGRARARTARAAERRGRATTPARRARGCRGSRPGASPGSPRRSGTCSRSTNGLPKHAWWYAISAPRKGAAPSTTRPPLRPARPTASTGAPPRRPPRTRRPGRRCTRGHHRARERAPPAAYARSLHSPRSTLQAT